MKPVWIDKAVVLAIHEEQLAEHGGLAGIRDPGLLDSALARPANLAHYGKPGIAALAAAAYAYGITQDHPFIDGNKRVSLIVAELFLDLNGYALDASDADCLAQWLGLADGSISEAQMAAWIGDNISRVG